MATVITNTDIGTLLGISGSPQKLNATEQLRGNNYIIVYGKSQTAQQNGFELLSKYNFAKITTPFGQPLSATNRFTVFVAPGVYTLTTFDIDLDTPYIDIISLSGETDVVINSTLTTDPITVSTSDIRLRGINLDGQAIQINSSYGNNYFENIIGGESNFSNPSTSGGDIAGNFKNCVGGQYSFGDTDFGQAVYDSTFENCTAGDYSFGATLQNCKLKNCTATFASFGQVNITNSTLTDCTASGDSFGTESGISGSKLTNCTGNSYCFGRANGTSQLINTTFTNCNAFEGSFGFYIEDCTLLNCKANENSFGMTSNSGIVSEISASTFTNCKAGNFSFGVRHTGSSAIFTDCIAGVESFGADQANGTYKNCKAGVNSFGAGLQGWGTLIAGGQFYNCVADEGSFGTEYANGGFYHCVCNNNGGWIGNTQSGMGGYAFSCKGMNPIGPGTAVYCIDAGGNPVNFGLTTLTNNI